MMLSFFVAGEPVPQGSMKAVSIPGKKFTQLIPVNDAELKRWRAKVVDVARLAIAAQHWTPVDGPVSVAYRFLLPMPASRPAAIRMRHIGYCSVKPDLDKLCRAVGDAMKDAGVFSDDSRIAKIMASEYEVREHSLCGAEIIVLPLQIDEPDVIEQLDHVLQRRRAAPRNRL